MLAQPRERVRVLLSKPKRRHRRPSPLPAARAAPLTRGGTAADPTPDAAELPPPPSRGAAGEVETDEGESCKKMQCRHLQCPVEANCRHICALFFREEPAPGEESPTLATPDLRLLLPSPPLRCPRLTSAIILRTSPPPLQNARVRSNAGTGGVSEHRTKRWGYHLRANLVREAHEILHPQAEVVIDHMYHT